MVQNGRLSSITDQECGTPRCPLTWDWIILSVPLTSMSKLPPNQSVAHSLTQGHSIILSFFTSGGYSEEINVKVRIPQIHDFSVVSLDALYGVSPVRKYRYLCKSETMEMETTGMSLISTTQSYLMGGRGPGPTSHSLPPFTTTTHSINVIAPDNATGEYTIYATVTTK